MGLPVVPQLPQGIAHLHRPERGVCLLPGLTGIRQSAQGILEPGQGNPCLGMQHRPGIGEHHQSLHRDPFQPRLPQMMPHIVHMGLVLQLGIV